MKKLLAIAGFMFIVGCGKSGGDKIVSEFEASHRDLVVR